MPACDSERGECSLNIRKKLTLASLLMILLPIAVSVMLCVMVLFFHGSENLNRLEELYDNDNGLLNVQTILYNYQNQILTYEPVEEIIEAETGTTESNDAWENWDEDDWDDDDEEEEVDYNVLLQEEIRRQNSAFGGVVRELTNIGYYYEIYYDHVVLASDLPEDATEKITDIAGEGYEKLASFAVADGNSSAVKRSYILEEGTLSILAYCENYVGSSSSSQVIRDILSILGLFVAVLVVSIVISIFILTRWLSSGMKKSLNQLSEGVRQVQDGNLSYRIGSKKRMSWERPVRNLMR